MKPRYHFQTPKYCQLVLWVSLAGLGVQCLSGARAYAAPKGPHHTVKSSKRASTPPQPESGDFWFYDLGLRTSGVLPTANAALGLRLGPVRARLGVGSILAAFELYGDLGYDLHSNTSRTWTLSAGAGGVGHLTGSSEFASTALTGSFQDSFLLGLNYFSVGATYHITNFGTTEWLPLLEIGVRL